MAISRQTFKILGIIVMIAGVVVAIYGYLQGSTEFTVQIGGVQPELSEQYGSSRLFQFSGIVGGLIIIYGGFRAFRYIPKSERDEGPIEYDS